MEINANLQFPFSSCRLRPAHEKSPACSIRATIRYRVHCLPRSGLVQLPLCCVQHKGRTYARLRFHVGPGGDIELPVQVDYAQPFAASDHEAWLAEYQANVDFFQLVALSPSEPAASRDPFDDDWLFGWELPFEEGGFIDKKEHSHAV